MPVKLQKNPNAKHSDCDNVGTSTQTERKLVVEIALSPCQQDRLWAHRNKGPLHNMHLPGDKTEDNH